MIMTMKTKTIVAQGLTKEEAIVDKFGADFDVKRIRKNATPMWQKHSSPAVGTPEFDLFVQNYIKINKYTSGDMFSITTVGGSKDTKLRPYKIVNVKQEGRSKFQTVISIVNKKTGQVYDTKCKTKAEAEKRAKEIVTEHHVDVLARKTKEMVGDSTMFYCNYSPSAGSKQGTYVVIEVI